MRAVLTESPTLVENGLVFSCVVIERNAAQLLNLHFTESPAVVAGAPAPSMVWRPALDPLPRSMLRRR